MKQHLFDNGTTVISHRKAEDQSRALVITFDPMHALDPDRPGFGEEFLAAHGYDVVTVQKRKDIWWQDISRDEFQAVIGDLARRYESVFTYGSSMGAYGSLYFASAVNARALSLSPRHPSYYALVGMGFYPKQLNLTHGPLREVADSNANHVVLVDPLHRIDGPYVDREVVPFFPRAEIIRLRYSSHPSIQVLNEGGVLKAFVLDFLGGRPVNKAAIRKARRRSKQYLQQLAEACATRGRPHIADTIRNRLQAA